jgi:N-acetylated-alpha-linked acidic dipeptidase
VIGPWTHARPSLDSRRIGEVDFGPNAGFDSDGAMLEWFDYWLAPPKLDERPASEGALHERNPETVKTAPVRLFVMGENRWRDEQEWPLARAKATPYYLRSAGRANTASGDGRLELAAPDREPADRYTYDPNKPVPTGAAGGYSRVPMDRREIEARSDVLVYSTPPLAADVEVTGPLAVTVWITSDARDTDFTATLVDVFPDGTARALNDGILRARYRGGKHTQQLLTPGEPTEITIDLGATSNLFRAGHRIRLEISSSNFPRFDRNPNTGGVFGEDREVRLARQTILHDAAHPSRLILPIVPRPALSERARVEGFEQRFLDGVSTDSISAIHRQVTEHPHIAGSARSMEVADRVRRALDRAGLATEVHEYLVHLSTPRSVTVEIVEPAREALIVREPVVSSDPDGAHRELGPAFVAYSASGSVTGPVVYANYGLPPDYAKLAAAGVDVRGKIVIARYARSHRAVKIHTAEQAGAAGIIIYSDPADDGFARGIPWPDGPWRADFQAQSGNGKYSWFWHGDPLTPGVGATPGTQAMDPARAPTLPKIPAVVLSWKEASRILSRLQGPAAPSGAGFQGALPFTYRLGPGPLTVRLDVQMDASRRPIRNVIGTIEGRDRDRWIVLGTHHDAWSFGGMDPGTGLSPVFEVARGLAALVRAGWKPERSIKFAFWDAEEFGLVGSTEYAEALQKDLREKAIVYINTDLSMRGRFDGGGTPSLRDFLIQVARDVPHFEGGSVYEKWRADEWQRQSPDRRRRGMQDFEVELAALGSGADFVAFQDFLGLPTLQMEFDFEGSYGPYHSNYDTRQYVERHVDPGFRVGQTLARVLGLSVMRLASADVLPFRYSHYARKIVEFTQTADGWAIDDAGRKRVEANLAGARQLATEAATIAAKIEAALARRATPGDPARARALNDALFRLEQRLLDESEPPATRWYRHVVYGWNIYSLYEGQPLPGLAEAIRLADAQGVQRETARLEQALRRFIAGLEEIARLAGAIS